jgi:WD40 repeat protein
VRAALATWVEDPRAIHRRLLDAWGDAMQLPHDYAWLWCGWYCVEARYPERLRELLLNPTWLQGKLDHTDIRALIGECERLERGRHSVARDSGLIQSRPAVSNAGSLAVRLLVDALRKSSHVLSIAPSQLSDQLFGRLRQGVTPELDKLGEELRQRAGRQKVRARFPNLVPAGNPLIQTLAGHEHLVNGALLLPDGKRAVSWAGDGMRRWDLETGQRVGEPLTGHTNGVRGALLWADGTHAMSWGNGGTLPWWDLEADQQVGKPLSGHTSGVRGALLRPDGRHAMSWGDDGTLRRWDLEAGQQVGKPLAGHRGYVSGALLLPDGRHVLSWSEDGTLQQWDLETGQQVGKRLTGHTGGVRGALVLADGKRALSWSEDRTLRAWDLPEFKELGCFYAEGIVAAIVDCGTNGFFVGDAVGGVLLPGTRCGLKI